MSMHMSSRGRVTTSNKIDENYKKKYPLHRLTAQFKTKTHTLCLDL
jgi:hypothetical protein